ncbi:hypothetical protein Q0590_32055 [Rhodocytophaga aerolata]|uniref:PH domain-containing protein n=1 Tax=Rhodocytophaga aerolata TaxID=455078 RepID=A0ABT8RFR1_9BACT|nr:hypothetical protein [Rhodocytophaga aerolata]MDO1450952.1 hypothetical protein [Rhodocytophaga aerolata]
MSKIKNFLYITIGLPVYDNDNMQKIYPLKVPSKIIQKSGVVGIFLIGLAFFIEFVMNGFSFPQTLSLLARILLLSGFSLSFLSASFLLFHRKKVTILLDDQGIHLPGYQKITWKSIQWYRFDIFSSGSGTRNLTLQYDGKKAVVLAYDDELLMEVEQAIKEQIALQNPLATDFRELKSSRKKAFALITLLTILHLAIWYYLDFQQTYFWAGTFVLLTTAGAILLEFTKKPSGHTASAQEQ